MIVGGYTLDLYCDGPNHKQLHPNRIRSCDGSYAGINFSDCAKQARSVGWKLDRQSNTALCRRCRDAARALASKGERG